MLLSPVLTLMEYAPGKSLMEVTSITNKVCYELGRLTSFDVLTNNWDRLPLIWNNKGNGENIILCNDFVIGIDHTICSIHPEDCKPQYDQYIEKVRCLVTELNGSPGPVLNKMREFILNCVGYDIGKEGELCVAQGLRDGIKVMVEKVRKYQFIRKLYKKLIEK
jgi:hypothetical protein